jgi:hypothetical protein
MRYLSLCVKVQRRGQEVMGKKPFVTAAPVYASGKEILLLAEVSGEHHKIFSIYRSYHAPGAGVHSSSDGAAAGTDLFQLAIYR